MPARSPLQINPTLQLTAIAEVSRRGRDRARVGVHDPAAVRWLLEALTRGQTASELPGAVRRQLVSDGILVRPRDVPRDINLEVGLRPYPRPLRRVSDALAIADGLHIAQGPHLPPPLASRTRNPEPFLPGAPILWVRDSASGLRWPYCLSARERAAIDRLLVDRAPSRLPARLRAALFVIGALDDPAAERARQWKARVTGWRRDLRTRGFAVISGLIPPAVAAALRTYFSGLEREGYLYGGHARRDGLPLLQGEPVLEFLAAQLAGLVAEITGESVPMTFPPYLRVYDPGGRLPRHRDRPVCRWNVDLVVGGKPAPTRPTAWPLWIESRGQRRAARLALGEAVLYRGYAVSHWRHRQRDGRSTAVASLHYGAPPAGARGGD
jgi:hypothetical protein